MFVVVLVQVLCYVLVEALVCVPVEQQFKHVSTGQALSEMSCVNLWKAAV